MSLLRSLSRVLLALVLMLPLLACEGRLNPFAGDPGDTLPDESDFVVSEPIRPPEFDFLWERAKFTLMTERYGVDLVRTRREDRRMVSRWKTLLAPARYKGVRLRVVVDFVDDEPGAYVIRLAVQVQRNSDVDAPMEPTHAVWEDQPADRERANVLIYRIETGFE